MSKYAPHRVSNSHPRATSSTICQKCLGRGHFTYECKSTRPYVSRPSRTQLLEKPHLLSKLRAEGKPSVDVPEEFKKKSGTADKILAAKEKERAAEKEGTAEKARKKAKRSSGDSSSLSDSESTSSGSDSDSDSDSSASSSSSSSSSASSHSRSSESSRSRERSQKRRVPRQRERSP